MIAMLLQLMSFKENEHNQIASLSETAIDGSGIVENTSDNQHPANQVEEQENDAQKESLPSTLTVSDIEWQGYQLAVYDRSYYSDEYVPFVQNDGTTIQQQIVESEQILVGFPKGIVPIASNISQAKVIYNFGAVNGTSFNDISFYQIDDDIYLKRSCVDCMGSEAIYRLTEDGQMMEVLAPIGVIISGDPESLFYDSHTDAKNAKFIVSGAGEACAGINQVYYYSPNSNQILMVGEFDIRDGDRDRYLTIDSNDRIITASARPVVKGDGSNCSIYELTAIKAITVDPYTNQQKEEILLPDLPAVHENFVKVLDRQTIAFLKDSVVWHYDLVSGQLSELIDISDLDRQYAPNSQCRNYYLFQEENSNYKWKRFCQNDEGEIGYLVFLDMKTGLISQSRLENSSDAKHVEY
ncbi:hypothetical protein IJJ08_01130 [bacterium]|nr:hypothetical protein [bacterium]